MPDRIASESSREGPKQIVLEITETGVFRDATDTLDILARLHMKGFALAIDDFGTGYASIRSWPKAPKRVRTRVSLKTSGSTSCKDTSSHGPCLSTRCKSGATNVTPAWGPKSRFLRARAR